MAESLERKTERYERMLADGCEQAEIVPDADSDAGDLAREHVEMAEAYLADGRHFCEIGELPDALAAFAYGHGWLDAAIRAELISAPTNPVGLLEED